MSFQHWVQKKISHSTRRTWSLSMCEATAWTNIFHLTRRLQCCMWCRLEGTGEAPARVNYTPDPSRSPRELRHFCTPGDSDFTPQKSVVDTPALPDTLGPMLGPGLGFIHVRRDGHFQSSLLVYCVLFGPSLHARSNLSIPRLDSGLWTYDGCQLPPSTELGMIEDNP